MPRRFAAISTSRRARSFSNADIDEAVKRLFATGLFSDVRINQSGSTLVVQVDEYSVVNQVLFQGNKKLKDAELANAVQLKPRGSFSQDTLNADVEAIKAGLPPDRPRRRRGHDPDHGSRRKPRERRLRDQRRRPHQDRRPSTSSATTPSATAACRTSSRPSARRCCPISCATTSMTKTSCAPTKRRCAASTTITAMPISRLFRRPPTSIPSTNEYTITFTVEEGERYTFGDVTIESNIAGVTAESLGGLIETQGRATSTAPRTSKTRSSRLTERWPVWATPSRR